MAKADMFLKLVSSAGPILGESNVPEHKDEIEIAEWSWGMSFPQALGGQGVMSKVAMAPLRFVKGVDRATALTMSAMYKNAEIKEAKLTLRKAGTGTPVEYLVITGKKGRIVDHKVGNVAPGDPNTSETFLVVFKEIEVTYAGQATTGSAAAGNSFTASVE
ncbi:Hcp family type VI secretion system effector [Pseudorhodoferax sp.]|uniref:Hcp family type VI secretion system effector n=1 Tax=Pseudorhodoferax sp. TaxID=1993553 RepID=UPI002DD66024|nr:type VI secretion system tube protein Hcp [Pseudorhodoferax sp.]